MDREEALETLRRPSGGGREPRPPGPRRWPWFVLGVLVLVVVVIVLLWWFFRPRAVAVETFTVPAPAAASAGAGLSASGYVVARERATVSSKITGMIQQVLVTEGQRVKKGQLVAVLDDSSERAAVQQSRAVLAADTALIGKAQAALTQAQLTLGREQKLIQQHMVSQADLDQAEASEKSAQAEFGAAKAQVAVDQALLASARLDQSYTRISAPFDGVVTQVYAQPGEMISPGAVGGFTQTGICELVNMKSLEVQVDVNENYLTQVKEGMPATVTLSPYPDRHFPAHVLQVVPVVNEQQATVEVHVGFDRLDPHILPGMQAQVFFYSTSSKAGTPGGFAPLVQIPAKAVYLNSGGSFVYVAENGKLKQRSVRVRQLPNGDDAVLSGLSGGERIVVDAHAPLHSGMAVRIRNGKNQGQDSP